MTPAARRYVTTIVATGLTLLVAVVGLDAASLVHHLSAGVVLLIAAVVAGELLPMRLGPGEGQVAPSTTFTFTLLLAIGVPAAALAQALACLLADLVDGKGLLRTAFNVAQYSLAILAAGAVLLLAGVVPVTGDMSAPAIAAILLAALTYYVVNTGLVAGVIALTTDRRLRDQLDADWRATGSTEGILLGLAPLAVLALHDAPALLPLIALPMVAVHRAGRQALIAERVALHDGLTGLPNRVLFAQRTERAIAAADRRGDRNVLLMLLDLDGFKEINDTLGHQYGDEVLRQVGGRIAGVVSPGDVVGRLGGDEFAVLLRTSSGSAAAHTVAGTIREAVAEPFDVAGVRLDIACSIGISQYEPGGDVDTLMRRADVAMYRAKEGHSGVERYAAEADRNSLRRLTLAGDLRGALERDEFVLHYQPQLDLHTGAVRSAEVLLRWPHPGRGDVAPAEFVALAEHTGLIVPLTTHVIDRAVHQCGEWRRRGLEIGVAINLSARTLTEPELPARVAETCERHGVATGALIFEITESMVVADPRRAGAVLAELHDLGVELAIDDFGTGYSSLEYLKSLPIDELKIDRSFVTAMAEDERNVAIVAATATLGRDLGLRVVAEGVESEIVGRRLAALGCNLGQGFLYGRAMPAAELEAFVAAAPGARQEVERALTSLAG
ncbi:MAG TPA: EAL domain-containing protein [Solirubrobacteraceae bacterium]